MNKRQLLADIAGGNVSKQATASAMLIEAASERKSGAMRAQEMTDEQLIFCIGEIESGDPERIARLHKIHVSAWVREMTEQQIEQRLKNLKGCELWKEN